MQPAPWTCGGEVAGDGGMGQACRPRRPLRESHGDFRAGRNCGRAHGRGWYDRSMADIADVQQEVGEVLVSELGLDGVRHSASGGLAVEVEGTSVFVDVFARGPQGGAGTVVSVYAPVAADVPITPELLGWVVQQSGVWVFGHVVLTPDTDAPERCLLTMGHNLLGEHLNRVELGAVVVAIASSGAALAQDVAARFGGAPAPA